MSENANFVVFVFWYSDNSISKVAYSEKFTNVEPDGSVTAEIDIPDGVDGLKAKAQIWDITNSLPMPLNTEINL